MNIFSKGVQALLVYRLSSWLARTYLGLPLVFVLGRIIQILYGIDIDYRARIGRNCKIIHGYGLVIGSLAVLGNDCVLYHGVTLGGKGLWSPAGMPILGDNVVVYPGAKILGKVKIASGVSIGANAVVVKDCLISGATYAGIPAKKLKSRI
jgi:serine O-acetyltransferase